MFLKLKFLLGLLGSYKFNNKIRTFNGIGRYLK